MSIASEVALQSRASSLAIRYALRELRGGLRGFYVFIACIALGVMAIAGVGSVAASLSEGLTREGRTLLGGDVAFSLIQREAKPEEVAFLRSRGAVSVAATMRAMARSADGRLALVELKAVDNNYPMLGALTLDPEMSVQKKDTGDTLRKCLRGLSAEHREIVDLVYYHEKSVEDVAEIVGIPENTVKTRLFYARKKLAELLKAAGVERGWP